ncbi:MAG TPA: DinB family protein [Acidimicrobiales bacterium]|nr:DinB family protein [Acidimicrobiales bacterium]
MTERDDLLRILDTHRGFLRYTLRDLTDEQAAARTTVSELCLAGILKHVTAVEEGWRRFIEEGAPALEPSPGEDPVEERANEFRMLPGETLPLLLERHDRVAHDTEELVRRLPSLDAGQALPEAPWFEPGASWSARYVLLHILAETAQHAGHADIVREALDGQKTMG